MNKSTERCSYISKKTPWVVLWKQDGRQQKMPADRQSQICTSHHGLGQGSRIEGKRRKGKPKCIRKKGNGKRETQL